MSVRAFRPIRNILPDEVRAKLLADVKHRFATMTPEQFAGFLQGLPAEQQAQAQRIRDHATAERQH